MATARKKSRAAVRLARPAPSMRVPASMEFLIFEDNGGDYYWTIVGGNGANLARSESFASRDDAEQAVLRIRDGAASALFDGARPVDLFPARDASGDDSDAERWLDEGGSFSMEAVAKWPAPR